MPDPKGDELFVRTGSAEARRPLKGFGHGVRKVQSAGRNQAVIIHTANGRHLQELESKFADVGFSNSEPNEEPIKMTLYERLGGVHAISTVVVPSSEAFLMPTEQTDFVVYHNPDRMGYSIEQAISGRAVTNKVNAAQSIGASMGYRRTR